MNLLKMCVFFEKYSMLDAQSIAFFMLKIIERERFSLPCLDSLKKAIHLEVSSKGKLSFFEHNKQFLAEKLPSLSKSASGASDKSDEVARVMAKLIYKTIKEHQSSRHSFFLFRRATTKPDECFEMLNWFLKSYRDKTVTENIYRAPRLPYH